MVRLLRTPSFALVLVAVLLPLHARRAEAAGEGAPASAASATEEAKRAAQQHFARARELYQQGNYPAAKAELEQARGLDPQAKDLTYNLGTVSEKLGQFDEALRYFREYLELESVTSQEKARAESIITRIEGAKRAAPAPAPTASATVKPPDPSPPPPPPEKSYGRLDVWTWTAIGVSGAGLAVGTIFGIRALSQRPKDGFVTGVDGSYDALTKKADDAHASAIVADVGFAFGILGAGAAAVLYFARTKPTPAPSTGVNSAALAPVPGGATLQVGGALW